MVVMVVILLLDRGSGELRDLDGADAGELRLVMLLVVVMRFSLVKQRRGGSRRQDGSRDGGFGVKLSVFFLCDDLGILLARVR